MSNPKDLGKLHNDGLQYIGLKNGSSPNLGDLGGVEENRKVLLDFYNQQKLPTSSFPSAQKVGNLIADIKKGSIKSTMLSNGVSPALANQVEALLDLCKSANSSNQLETEVLSFLKTVKLSSDEMFALEVVANTAISSAKFWEAAATSPSHPFHSWAIGGPGEEVVFARVKWWRLLGDCVGVCVGVAAGGFTPAGVAAGAALGTMISSNID